MKFVKRFQMNYLDGFTNCHSDYIMKIDQTPVWSMVAPRQTIDTKRTKSFKVKLTPGTKSRITIALTITTSGKQLPEVVIFEGKRQGSQISKNLSSTPPYTMCTDGTLSRRTPGWMKKPWASGSKRFSSHNWLKYHLASIK